MSFKKVYEKEKNIVLYGQSATFRIVKYAIIFPIAALVYLWKGLKVFSYVLLVAVVLSLFIHFLFRYKTDAWTKSWWLYKSK